MSADAKKELRALRKKRGPYTYIPGARGRVQVLRAHRIAELERLVAVPKEEPDAEAGDPKADS